MFYCINLLELHIEVTVVGLSEKKELKSYVIFRSKFKYEAVDFLSYAVEYELFITIIQVPR